MKQANRFIACTIAVMATTTVLMGSIFAAVTLTPALLIQSVDAARIIDPEGDLRKAPPAITGDNVYVAWWNGTVGQPDINVDVFFRASTDGGQSFGERVNLSNTTDSDSWNVETDSDADSVVITWWETNQTDNTPVMRVSNDNGATFGPVLILAMNGTIGQAAAEGEGEGEE